MLGFCSTVSFFAARLIRKVLPGKKAFLCVAAVLRVGAIFGSAGVCVAGGLMWAKGISEGPLFFCGGLVANVVFSLFVVKDRPVKTFTQVGLMMFVLFLAISRQTDGGPAEVLRNIGRFATGASENTRSCRDCSNTVSTDADTCPDCGAKKPFLNAKEWKGLQEFKKQVDNSLRKFDLSQRSMVRQGLMTDAEYRDNRRREIESRQLENLQNGRP